MALRWVAYSGLRTLRAVAHVDPTLCFPHRVLSFVVHTHTCPRLHYRLLTLCPWASSGPQGLYTTYIQPIYSLYAANIQAIYMRTTAALLWRSGLI